LALLLLAGSWAMTLHAAEWHYETVSQAGGGKFSSMRVDASGNVHVSYVNDATNQLNYSFWDHTIHKWFTTTLDASGGFCSLALDSHQRPRISYTDYGTGRLKYTYWDGATWHKETIQIRAKEIFFYTSLTLDAQDNPSISYYEYWGTGDNYELHLRLVAWNGKYWEVRTVDPTPGSGKFNSMALDSAGNLHVAYANVASETASLRYATWNGKSWNVEILEGDGPMNLPVFSVALIVDKYDIPHITYTDVRNHLVKYATRKDGKWQMEVVDALVREAYPDKNGLVIDDRGIPYMSYYDSGAGVLKLAYRKNGKWIAEVVDQQGAGLNSSLQIDHDTIWLTYADESGRGLKCARRPLD